MHFVLCNLGTIVRAQCDRIREVADGCRCGSVEGIHRVEGEPLRAKAGYSDFAEKCKMKEAICLALRRFSTIVQNRMLTVAEGLRLSVDGFSAQSYSK